MAGEGVTGATSVVDLRSVPGRVVSFLPLGHIPPTAIGETKPFRKFPNSLRRGLGRRLLHKALGPPVAEPRHRAQAPPETKRHKVWGLARSHFSSCHSLAKPDPQKDLRECLPGGGCSMEEDELL